MSHLQEILLESAIYKKISKIFYLSFYLKTQLY